MILPCHDDAQTAESVATAVQAVHDGRVIVLPTDTVYGVGADAFQPDAVAAVLAAKGRGRQMPPPVLIPSIDTVLGLGMDVAEAATALMREFWPGALTVIVTAQPSLAWDLGDTGGTVALRVPDHPVALAVLKQTGPLAVTSANLTGHPAAMTAADAEEQLGESVAVYLDGGQAPGGEASTIVRATGPHLEILRLGALSREQLAAVVGEEAFGERAE